MSERRVFVVEADGRRRVSVGRLGLQPGQRFRVAVSAAGILTLSPVALVAACGGVPGPLYPTCEDARNDGAAPLHEGDEGYGRHLDRDGDGTACEEAG